MAHVYGGVLAWDEVAENMAAGACIAKVKRSLNASTSVAGALDSSSVPRQAM